MNTEKRMETQAAITKLQAAGYTVDVRSCFLNCSKGSFRYPLDITNGTVNWRKVSYLVFIA